MAMLHIYQLFTNAASNSSETGLDADHISPLGSNVRARSEARKHYFGFVVAVVPVHNLSVQHHDSLSTMYYVVST
jgi:hypothetical protein